MHKKSAYILFLGNIKYDSRCYNLYNSLTAEGWKVSALGFDWLSPQFKTEHKNSISIYKLSKEISSIFFYLKFSFIILYKLIFSKYDLYFAEDVYTLPFTAVIAKLKKAKLVYDAREIYDNLAGLVGKKHIQKILSAVESRYIKYADHVIATGDLDADYLKKKYVLSNIIVIRNLPLFKKPESPINFCKMFDLPPQSKFLVYQGVILKGRGMKYAFKLLKKLDGYYLIVIGDGEYKEYYQKLAADEGIAEKVKFTGRIEQDKLYNYTAGGTIGLSLIENISLSYYYALPNKLFEYIFCELPVIVSDLPQMKQIVENYETGFAVDPENDELLLSRIKEMEDSQIYNRLKENCRKASLELNWDKEILKLLDNL